MGQSQLEINENINAHFQKTNKDQLLDFVEKSRLSKQVSLFVLKDTSTHTCSFTIENLVSAMPPLLLYFLAIL
jgi:hypothetical protein